MDGEPAKLWERPWTTDEMRQQSSNWNLAGDAGLLNHLQQFSKNLLARTHATEVALDKLVEDLETTSTSVQNATNSFLFLANTQFVENRVYDDDEKETPPEEKKGEINLQKTKEDQEVEVFQNVKKALEMGLSLLETHFETVEVPASDSEEEESSASVGRLVLKPKNPYITRPLPYLIGSKEFMDDDKVGLGDVSSDTEGSPDQNVIQFSESDDEMEQDEFTSPKKSMVLPSSDSEDSEPESDRSEILAKQKKLRTLISVKSLDEEEKRDLFGQESPPESDEVATVKGVSSSFSNELVSKLDAATSQNLSNRERIKDMFASSSEPEDDTGLFSKGAHSFSEKQGLFDDLEGWQSTSDSLWNNDSISSIKAGSQSKTVIDNNCISDHSEVSNEYDNVFRASKTEVNGSVNVTGEAKISVSTPQGDSTPKLKTNYLFGTAEAENLFNQNPKDSGSASGNSSLFAQHDLEEDDLFAVPSSRGSSQPGTSQNLSKKKKLPGAVPILVGVDLFGDISPITPNDSAVRNNSNKKNGLANNNDFPQDSSNGIGKSIDTSKKNEESERSDHGILSNEGSSLFECKNDKLIQNVVTSSKIVDEVGSKSLFSTEISTDSLFDKSVSDVLNRNPCSKSNSSVSSNLKPRAKKPVSIFDDSDSGEDELLFSSTSSTSSRSRRSQGSGDVLGNAIEKKTLSKKGLFENDLFGAVNKDEPDVDIFSSQNYSKINLSTEHSILCENDFVDESKSVGRKIISNIFDDIDEVDDIFAVPKVNVEKTCSVEVTTDLNNSKLSLFPEDLNRGSFFSENTKETNENEVVHSQSNTSNIPHTSDAIIGATPLLFQEDSPLNISVKKNETESQDVKTKEPHESQKPKLPLKPTSSSSEVGNADIFLSLSIPNHNKETNEQNVNDLKAHEAEAATKNDFCEHVKNITNNDLKEGKDFKNPGLSVKPEPPRTLNIRKTTDIVFESPPNDLFETTLPSESMKCVENLQQVQIENIISSKKFSKLLEGFVCSPEDIVSEKNVPEEETTSIFPGNNKKNQISKVFDAKEQQKKSISNPTKLLIDPRTLLPGSRPPSLISKSDGAIGFDKPAEVTSTLHSVGKERVKIQVKRRPQTRKARHEALRASSLEYDSLDVALISQLPNTKNEDVHCAVNSSSLPSCSPVLNAAHSSVKLRGIDTVTNSVSELGPDTCSEGQSSVSESDHLPVITDVGKNIVSDQLSANSNALSPLTDEEDLFAVPHELPFDDSSNREMANDRNNLFGGAPVLSPLAEKCGSEGFETFLSLKSEENKNFQNDFDNTIKNVDIFKASTLDSALFPHISVSPTETSGHTTKLSGLSNKTMFGEHHDQNQQHQNYLEKSAERRDLFDDIGQEEESEGEEDDDLFSTAQKAGKSGKKYVKNTLSEVCDRTVFPPDHSLECISKDNTQGKQMLPEEFLPSSLQNKHSNEEKCNANFQSRVSKSNFNVERKNDDPILFPKKIVESSPQKENEDLFAIDAKCLIGSNSAKLREKNVSQERVKFQVESLFGDDSLETDDLFGSSSLPKMSMSGSSSSFMTGPKLKVGKVSLFDDVDDDDNNDDNIFSNGLTKNKGTKSETLFSNEEDSLSALKGADDVFLKGNSSSRNQVSKTTTQKVQSFEDPLTVFNK